MLNFCIVDPAKSSHANWDQECARAESRTYFFVLFDFIATADYFLYDIVTKVKEILCLFFNKNEYVRNHQLETIEEASRNTTIKIF